MKYKLLTSILSSWILLSFTTVNDKEIGNCYLSFKDAAGLTVSRTDRLPDDAANKTRMLSTANGDIKLTVLDGYRVLYNNDKNAVFVNLKVEISDQKTYGMDTTHLLENLKYLNSRSTNMETKDMMRLSFNGYTIYGVNRSGIEVGYNLGTFVMFPSNNIVVYFYFQNIKPEARQFKDSLDYRKQRNNFLDAYTHYLRNCTDK